MQQTNPPIDPPAIARRRRPVLSPSSPTNALQSLPEPAIVVGLALKFALLHGRKRAVLPFIITELLTELAGQGDPTCRLVLDWLAGDVPDPSRNVATGAATYGAPMRPPLHAPATQKTKTPSSVRAAATDEIGGSV